MDRFSLRETTLRFALPALLLGCGMAVFAVLVNRPNAAVPNPEIGGPPTVECVTALTYSGGLDIEVDGLVVPFREIEVSAEVAGMITFKSDVCRAGKYVYESTSLIQIDSLEYELAVRRLERELEQAEANLKELDVELVNVQSLIEIAKEDVQLQRKELRRTERMSESGVITDSQIDRVRRDALAARNSLIAQTNQHRLLESRRNRLVAGRGLVMANLDKAHLDLKRTQLAAPVTGVVVDDVVEQGSYVQPGQVLYIMEDTSAVEVQCTLRMDQLVWLWSKRDRAEQEGGDEAFGYQVPPTPATVVYELAGKQYLWQGTLVRFDGIGVDDRTRPVPCRVVVDQPRSVTSQTGTTTRGPKVLVRGMYVKVILHIDPEEALISVPEVAIRPGNKVWRFQDGKLVIDRVDVVRVLDDSVLVSARPNGLQPGDQVVISPLAGARDGIEVEAESKTTDSGQ